MNRSFAILGVPFLGLIIPACGGKPPPPADPSAQREGPSAAVPGAPGGESPSGPKESPPIDKQAAAEAAPHEDVNEKEGAIELAPLVDKAARPSFPKQAVGDHDCLGQLAFNGHHKADFATLIGKCGTPTGMLEYTKPAEGRLHAKHDKRDEFRLKVQKGMCYRYFAVADEGIRDIDIVILRKGALLATDRTEQSIAVIETEKLWCADEDMDLQFNIEVDGRGAGGYTFGVWTRPKK